MAGTFGTFSTPSAGSAGQEPRTPKEPFRFGWRLFWIYGAFWCAIFFAVVCVQKAGYFVYDQHRQIRDLIDRLHRYEDPDFYGGDGGVTPDDGDEDNGGRDRTSLSAWVKANLPAKGVDERPAVAEVFLDLADKLDDGSLKGEKDAFSEGIARLWSAATRSSLFKKSVNSGATARIAESDNRRNETKPKKLRSKFGEFSIDVPKDRNGAFEPQVD